MKKTMRLLAAFIALLMLTSLLGCNKKETKKETASVDTTAYIGTWQGGDHDGENVVHYLVFDENGYWNVHMNYAPLVKAITQLPGQLVSFKAFREVQNSAHTQCYFEYVENTDQVHYIDLFSVNEEGVMSEKGAEVQYARIAADSGELSSAILDEARDLFDRAFLEAHNL